MGLDRALLRRASRLGARAVGAILLLGSLLVAISLILPHPGIEGEFDLVLIAAGMTIAGGLFLAFAPRFSLGAVYAALGATALVDGFLIWESGLAAGQYGAVLTWIVLVTAYLFPRRAAYAMLAWVLLIYGATLEAVGHSVGYSGLTRWIFAAVSLSVVTTVATVLVAERSRADTRARRFFDLSEDLLCTYSATGYFVEFNSTWEQTLGYTAEEMCSRPAIEFVHPDDRERTRAASRTRERMGRIADFENRYRTKSGEWRWLRWSATASEDDDGLVYARAVDVTGNVEATAERERLLLELSDLAGADSLTGLPNRRSIEARLEEEIVRAKERSGTLCLALFDLDSFKAYNDANGHLAGDEILCTLAESWQELVRESDVIARWGGEEFMVVLPGCNLAEAQPIVERLRVATPPGQTCSAGLAEWSPGMSGQDVIREADGALYEAKAAGRDVLTLAG